MVNLVPPYFGMYSKTRSKQNSINHFTAFQSSDCAQMNLLDNFLCQNLEVQPFYSKPKHFRLLYQFLFWKEFHTLHWLLRIFTDRFFFVEHFKNTTIPPWITNFQRTRLWWPSMSQILFGPGTLYIRLLTNAAHLILELSGSTRTRASVTRLCCMRSYQRTTSYQTMSLLKGMYNGIYFIIGYITITNNTFQS